MKQRSTTSVSGIRGIVTKSTIVAAAVLMVGAAPLYLTTGAGAASISELQAQINALKGQQAGLQQTVQGLDSQANTLANKVSSLQAQIASMENQIALSQAQYDQLQQQITDTQKKIADDKASLSSLISSIYVQGGTSPLEMLASSKNISDFINAQTYRTSVSNKLSDTIKQINALEAQLVQKQQAVKLTLANQQAAESQVAAIQAQQQQLLSQTQGQEAAYQQLVQSNQSQQDQLAGQIAAQMAAAIRGGGARVISVGGSGGGYPYACQLEGLYSPWTDNGGYGCSQCVSYAAWKMGQVTGMYPVGWGNADNFPGNAAAAGFNVSYSPHANSIVYFPPGVYGAGEVGHVAWVEGVSGDTITVSQYNYNTGSGWGQYSMMSFQDVSGMQYIYP